MGQYHSDSHKLDHDGLKFDLADCYLFIHAHNERMLKDLQQSPALYDLIYAQFEYDLSSKLISLAIKLRILDDKVSSLKNTESLANQYKCGRINLSHKKKESSTTLKLRTAFDKIIHCNGMYKKIIFGHNCNDILEIVLGSTEKNKSWLVTVHLNQFIFESFNFIEEADELLLKNSNDT